MTIGEFRELNALQQFRVFRNAVEVGMYDDGFTIRRCHQVDDFYVEYIIDTTDNFRMFMLCHRNTAWLDKYFAQCPALSLDEIL